MDKFKIDLFKEEYGKEFVDFKSLSEKEYTSIKDEIISKYQITDKVTIIDWLENNKTYLENLDAKDGFVLTDFLDSLSIQYSDTVYINWFHFDEIDRFNIDDINLYFDDIWFPSSDDIDIFDKNTDWIISIRHDGIVSYLKK